MQMNLKLKFNLVFALLFAVALVAAGAIVYRLVLRNAHSEIVHDAQRMMDVSLAVRDYTVTHIKPHLDPLLDRHFLPETVPAFAATETLNRISKSQPGYGYKEATLNPTNPRNAAVEWEREVVERFRADKTLKEQTGDVETPKGRFFYVARPIQIVKPACLACHDTPDTAPISLIKRYGREHGFGWQLDEIVGAQVVSVPTQLAYDKAHEVVLAFLGTLAGVFVLLFLALNLLQQRWVVTPVRQVAHAANRFSQGDMDTPEFSETRQDEIGSLQRSYNRMRRSLLKAMDMLRR
jgi:HAMP domain-containing protein